MSFYWAAVLIIEVAKQHGICLLAPRRRENIQITDTCSSFCCCCFWLDSNSCNPFECCCCYNNLFQGLCLWVICNICFWKCAAILCVIKKKKKTINVEQVHNIARLVVGSDIQTWMGSHICSLSNSVYTDFVSHTIFKEEIKGWVTSQEVLLRATWQNAGQG